MQFSKRSDHRRALFTATLTTVGGVLLVAGCQTTRTGALLGRPMDASAALDKLPADCFQRPPFTGQVYVIDDDGGEAKPREIPVTRYHIQQGEQIIRRGSLCICGQSFNMRKLTESEAKAFASGAAANNLMKFSSQTFRDEGARKILEYSGESNSFAVDATTKGIIHFEGRCIQSNYAWAARGKEDQIEQFLAGVYDVRRPKPVTPPMAGPTVSPAAPASQPSAAEVRLEALKDLLDRKVITRSEYDERRRAILEGL